MRFPLIDLNPKKISVRSLILIAHAINLKLNSMFCFAGDEKTETEPEEDDEKEENSVTDEEQSAVELLTELGLKRSEQH